MNTGPEPGLDLAGVTEFAQSNAFHGLNVTQNVSHCQVAMLIARLENASNNPHLSYRWLPRKPKEESTRSIAPRAMSDNLHLPRPNDASMIVSVEEARPE